MQLPVIKSDSNDNFINSSLLMEQNYVSLEDWEDLRQYYTTMYLSICLNGRQVRIDIVTKF